MKERQQQAPMQTEQNITPSIKTIRFALGAAAVVVFLALALLAACGGDSLDTNADLLPTPASTLTEATITPSAEPTPHQVNTPGPSAHEGDEGLVLGQETGESVYQGASCQADAPVRNFDVAAINIEISLNRFLDFDPIG